MSQDPNHLIEKKPVLWAFYVSWSALHWKVFLALFSISSPLSERIDRISAEIHKSYWGLSQGAHWVEVGFRFILFPFLAAVFFTIGINIVNNWATNLIQRDRAYRELRRKKAFVNLEKAYDNILQSFNRVKSTIEQLNLKYQSGISSKHPDKYNELIQEMDTYWYSQRSSVESDLNKARNFGEQAFDLGDLAVWHRFKNKDK